MVRKERIMIVYINTSPHPSHPTLITNASALISTLSVYYYSKPCVRHVNVDLL